MCTEITKDALFQLLYTGINIPGYNICTGLNQKNLFKTLKSYFYDFVVHVPLNTFKSDGQEKSTKILISWQELKNQFLSFFVYR